MVNAGLVKLSQIPRWKAYFSKEQEWLCRAFMESVQDAPVKRMTRLLPPRIFIGLMNALFIPGMAHHFLFRKKFIEHKLTEAIAGGTSQVIVLGAGFDTLALRMAGRYPHVRFIEVDLPNTQTAKKHVMEKIGFPAAHNCALMPADLAKTKLADVLQNVPGFDTAAPTLIILEGVLMYLTEGDVTALFDDLRKFFTGQLKVVFGALSSSDDEGAWQVRMVNAWLGRKQERTKWHCSSAHMPAFMDSLGYKMAEWVSYKQLQRAHCQESEMRKAIPEEDENYYVVEKN
jgi:methyltransferase (TIGR00027 family)